MEYYCVKEIRGPIIVTRGGGNPGYRENVLIKHDNKIIKGQVLESSKDYNIIQTFKKLEGVSSEELRVEFKGTLLKFPVSEDIIGRVFNGAGEPLDNGPSIIGEERLIEGRPINPLSRKPPQGVIETGISAIDILNTLIIGQKLPIFTGSGLSHLKMIKMLIENSKIMKSKENLNIIFCGMGLTFDEYDFIKNLLKGSGILKRGVFYLNKAEDPIVERIILPRIALTNAEYLAFEKEKQVLVIMYDLTNYADALREISTSRGEFPGRMSYPPYLYTDLASLMERSGITKGINGSITQIPILTMPGDDITHPVPDLTGYITEGQIILDRSLDKEGIFPPINILPSLSRLMHEGSEGITREDHLFLGNMLYSSYANFLTAKKRELISGYQSLSETDKKYLRFGEAFKKNFLEQEEVRSFNQSLDIAWNVVKLLPDFEKSKIPEELKNKIGEE